MLPPSGVEAEAIYDAITRMRNNDVIEGGRLKRMKRQTQGVQGMNYTLYRQ